MSFIYNRPKICTVCSNSFLGCQDRSSYCSYKCRKKASDLRYYIKNRKKILKKNREWDREHREYLNQIRREKRKNPIKRLAIREREKKYQNTPLSKAYARIRVIARRARLKGSDGTHNLIEWERLKQLYDYTCPKCKQQEPKIKLTEDHIVPLSKGGANWIWNIQPLCIVCNKEKGRKIVLF